MGFDVQGLVLSPGRVGNLENHASTSGIAPHGFAWSSVCLPVYPIAILAICEGRLGVAPFCMASSSRSRDPSDPDCIAEVLCPFVNSRFWLSYTTKLDGPVEVATLKSKASLWMQFTNGSIAQKKMERAMQIVLQSKGGFGLSEAQSADWCNIMAKRLRAALRHWTKSSKTKWAQEIMRKAAKNEEAVQTEDGETCEDAGGTVDEEKGGEQVDETEDEDEDEEEEETDGNDDLAGNVGQDMHEVGTNSDGTSGEVKINDKEYFYGYEAEIGKAWRVDASMKKAMKEYTANIFIKSGHDLATDFIFAKFDDGTEKELTDVTVARFKGMSEAKPTSKTASKNSYFYEGKTSNGKRVCVMFKKDRRPSVILTIDGKQKGMVKVSQFDSIEAAGAFMTALALKVVSGELEHDNVNDARDKLLRITMTRPAVASDARPSKCSKHDETGDTSTSTPSYSSRPSSEVPQGESCAKPDNPHVGNDVAFFVGCSLPETMFDLV